MYWDDVRAQRYRAWERRLAPAVLARWCVGQATALVLQHLLHRTWARNSRLAHCRRLGTTP